MKGNAKLIDAMNQLLAEELTAINQYMVHAEMCDNWSYARLHGMLEKRAVTEMKHAEKLIDRILFLEGQPVVSHLEKITIGAQVPEQFRNDLALELGAVQHYNNAIKLAVEVGDNATKDILEAILDDEDEHVDEIEGNLDQIEQIGTQVYLSQQMRQGD